MNAIVFFLSRTGSVSHSLSQRSYHRLTVADRFVAASITGFDITGFAIHTDCTFEDVTQDGSVIGVRAKNWGNVLNRRTNNSEFVESFKTLNIPSECLKITLRDALILKYYGFDVLSTNIVGSMSFPGVQYEHLELEDDIYNQILKLSFSSRGLLQSDNALQKEVFAFFKRSRLYDFVQAGRSSDIPDFADFQSLTMWFVKNAPTEQIQTWFVLMKRVFEVQSAYRTVRSELLRVCNLVSMELIKEAFEGQLPITEGDDPVFVLLNQALRSGVWDEFESQKEVILGMVSKLSTNVTIVDDVRLLLKYYSMVVAYTMPKKNLTRDDLVAVFSFDEVESYIEKVRVEGDATILESSDSALPVVVDQQGIVDDTLSFASDTLNFVRYGPKEARRIINSVDSLIGKMDHALSIPCGVTDSLLGVKNMVNHVFKNDTSLPPELVAKVLELSVIVCDAFDGTYFSDAYTRTQMYVNSGKMLWRVFSLFGLDETVLRAFLMTDWACELTRVFSTGYRDAENSVRAEGSAYANPLVALVGTLVGRKVPSSASVTKVLEVCKAVNLTSGALRNLRSFVDWFCSWLPLCLRQWLYEFNPCLSWFDLVGGPMCNWYNEVFKLVTPENAIIVTYDCVMQKKVIELWETGHEYLVQLAQESTREVAAITRLVYAALKHLDGMREGALIARGRTPLRPTPFCIYVYGKSGIGKSQITSILAELFAPEGLPRSQLFYAINPANDNFDGYTQQHSVGIDDFDQFATSSDLELFFKMVTNTPFYPRFASMENTSQGVKGTAFTSSVVILTSNTGFPRNNDVKCPVAVFSRRNMLWEMRFKSRIESDLTPRCDPDRKAFKDDFSHLEFVHRHAETGAELGVYSFQDFLILSLQYYKKHVGVEQRVTRNLGCGREIITHIKAKYGSAPNLVRVEGDDTQDPSGNLFRVGSTVTDNPDYCSELGCPLLQDGIDSKHMHFGRVLLVPEDVFVESSDVLVEAKNREWVDYMDSLPDGWRAYIFKFPHGSWPSIISLLKDKVTRVWNMYPWFKWVLGVASSGGLMALLLSKCFTKGDQDQVEAEGAFQPSPSGAIRQERVKRSRGYKKVRAEAAIEVARYADMLRSKVKGVKTFELRLHVKEFLEKVLHNLEDTLDFCMESWDKSREEKGSEIYDEIRRIMKDLWAFFEMWWSNEYPFSDPKFQEIFSQRLVDYTYLVDWFMNVDGYEGQLYKDDIEMMVDKNLEKGKEFPLNRFAEWKVMLQFVGTFKHVMDVQPQAEECSDGQAEALIAGPLRRNVMSVAVCSEGYNMRTMALGLTGGVVLAPLHLFCGSDGTLVSQDAQIDIHLSKGNILLKAAFDPRRIAVIQGYSGPKDMCLYNFGAILPASKNIIEHFIDEADLDYLSRAGFGASLYTVKKKDAILDHIRHVVSATPMMNAVAYVVGSEDNVVTLCSGWKYKLATQIGYCGAPLVAHNTRMRRKIVGVHVAGKPETSTGYSELITRNMIQHTLEQLLPPKARVEGSGDMLFLDQEKDPMLFPEGNFTFQGLLKDAPRLSEKTEIRPSVIHDKVWTHTTEPSILTPRDVRWSEYGLVGSPLEKALSKYGCVNIPFSSGVLRAATDALSYLIKATFRKPVYGVLDLDKAINGVPLCTHMPSMDMTTSPGYPMCKFRPSGEKGKAFLFERDVDSDHLKISNPLLQRLVDEVYNKALRGERTTSLWTCALKDERRPIAKNKQGKTRAFVIPPVQFTIVCRQFFLDFCDAFYGARLQIPSAVGMDPESLDWHSMITQLLEFGNEGFDGDFGNWDGTMKPEVLEAVIAIINEWYADESKNQLARVTLLDEMIHTDMVGLTTVFRKHNGNPSGNPLTVVVNTLCNIMYFLCAWIELAPPEYKDPSFYFSMVRSFFYGDDNIFVPKEVCRTFFSFENLKNFFLKYGIEYTEAAKNSDTKTKLVSIMDLSFLKRKTVKIGKWYCAKLDIGVIEEMVNWIKDCDDPLEASIENALASLRFAYFHGPQQFEDMRQRMIEAFVHIGGHVVLPSYDYFNRLYGENCGLPMLAVDAHGISLLTDICRVRVEGETDKGVLPFVSDNSHLGIVTQTQVGSESHGDLGMPHMPLALSTVSEKNWSVSALAERPTYLGTVPWATSDTDGTLLQQYNAPMGLLSSNSINHIPFKIFQYWRGTIVITAQVNGTRYHSGKLMVGWVPVLTQATTSKWQARYRASLSTLNHIRLDPSISSQKELRIPFQWYETFLNLADPVRPPVCGVLVVMVANQLGIGVGGASSVDVVLTVRFEDNHFHVPRPVSVSGLPAIGSLKEVERVRVEGNTYSVNNNFDHVARATLGQEMTGTDVAKNARVSLDKPTNTLEPTPIVRSGIGYMSNAQNIPAMEKLNLYPGKNMDNGIHHFGIGVDEARISYLTRIPTLWKTVTWTTSYTVSSALITPGYLAPLEDVLSGAVSSGSAAVSPDYVLPIRDFVSAPFEMWSGSLIYDIEIVCGTFHSGKLFFGVHYGVADAPTALADITAQYGAYIDLNEGKHIFRYRVPYTSNTLAKRVPNCAISTGAPGVISTAPLDYILGRYTLTVINQLVAPDGTAQSISINIWVSCGDDYRLHYLGLKNSSIRPKNVSGVVPSGDEDFELVRAEGDSTEIPPEILLAPQFSTPQAFLGEEYDSILDCLKRFAPCGRTEIPIETSDTTNVYLDIVNLSWLGVIPPENSLPSGSKCTFGMGCGLYSYFYPIFAGNRGNVRLKITYSFPINRQMRSHVYYSPIGPQSKDGTGVLNPYSSSGASTRLSPSNCYQSLLRLVPHDCGFASSIDQAVALVSSPPTSVSDPSAPYHIIEVPAVTELMYFPNYLDWYAAVFDNVVKTRGCLIVAGIWEGGEFAPSVKDRVVIDYYWAAGDDFRLGLFLGAPVVNIISVNTGQYHGMWPDYY